MMRKYVLALSLLFVLGCARKNTTDKGFWDPVLKDTEYAKTYDRWTKRDSVYSNFDMSAVTDVTFFNSEVREAYIDKVALDYRMSEEEAKALAAEQLAENEAFDVFVVSMRTRQYGWSDLGSKSQLWNIQLESSDSSTKVPAEEIRKVSYKNERARQYYRKMDRFSETYEVRFPKDPLRESKEIVLHITGPVGSLRFPFERVERDELP